MINQWSFSLLKIVLILLSFQTIIYSQFSCINASTDVCIGACVPVDYVGNNSMNASYSWSNSCGTISNPTLQNPHEACFTTLGLCTITLITQEPGSPPETCQVQVNVHPLPTARFVIRTDSVCSGNCLGIRVDLTGTPPFVITYRDTTGIHFVRSGFNSTVISLCPTASQFVALVDVEDANCRNTILHDFFRIKVFPPFKASIYQQYSMLCASPPAILYRWFECGTTNLVANRSCFFPPKEDCYCAVVFNGFCNDTICANFKCNLDCGIEFQKPSFVGDQVKIKYRGNGGPSIKKTWIYTIDNINYLNSNDDSLNIQFNSVGRYIVRLDVEEGICKSSCLDTIIIDARPCTCASYNKNEIKKKSSGNSGCCYDINGDIASNNCFNAMKILTSSGTFNNINSSAGWSLTNVNAQNFVLQPTTGKFPIGKFKAGDFCVLNASQYTITVYYYFINTQGTKDSCKYQYNYTCQQAPMKCDSLDAFLELKSANSNSCCYNVKADIGRVNYYNKILVNINSGTFSNVTAAITYSISNQSGQGFTINHNSNFIPSGLITPGGFCINGIVNPVTVTLSFIKTGSGINDTCRYQFKVYCPDDGFPKQQCCDSTKANLNSTGGNTCCWNLTSFSTLSKCFSKICITSSSGNFSGVMANAGWTSSQSNNGICFTPTSGTVSSGNINPGKFCMLNFTNPITFTIDYYDSNNQILPDCKQKIIKDCPIPPPCSCDSLDNQITQTSVQAGKCCYNFQGYIPHANCYTKIGVSVSSGSFTNIVPATGYLVFNNSSSSFTLNHSSGHLLKGSIFPATFCVTGATLYTITIHYFYLDQNGIEQKCSFSETFDCPGIGPVCGCDSLNTLIDQISANQGKCCHNFTSHVGTSNCFKSITVSTTSGTIGSIIPMTGYLVSNQTSSSFKLTHTLGFIPIGNITPASFCISGSSLYTLTVSYTYTDKNGIDQKCIETMAFDCPKVGPVCSCDSLSTNFNSLSNSTGKCCYSFISQINTAQCFTKISVSTTAGTISNIVPATGFVISNQSSNSYLVTHTSGFIPFGTITPSSFCINGATIYTITIQYYYIDLNGQEQICIKSQTFDCPAPNKACNCDSLLVNINQTSNNPGKCCNVIQATIPNANCFVAISVNTTNGTLSNVVPDNNYTIGNLTTNSFNIGHTSGFIPQGNIQPVSFCVNGATQYGIIVKFFYFNNGKYDSCQFSKNYECKPSDTSIVCEPSTCNGNLNWQNIANVSGGIIYDVKNYNCKLYAAGQFTQLDNQNLNNIAEWNGVNWSPLSGGGLNGTVRAMTVHNGVLYVGGQFTMAGNVAVNNIAAWNGSTWSNVGGGVTGINPSPIVYSLFSTNNGLVVGGQFALTGNNSLVNNIALWNGVWSSPFANGIPYPVSTLRVYNNDLYAAGAFFGNPYNCISKWNGTNWSSLTSNGITLVNNNLFHGVESSIVWNNELIIGGHYANADGVANTQHISRWNGTNFIAMTEGDISTSSYSVNDFIIFNNELFVAGEYDMIGSTNSNGVTRTNGSQWLSTNHPNKVTWALESYDSCGAHPCQLYSAGEGFVNLWICVTNTKNMSNSDWIMMFPNPARDRLNLLINEVHAEEIYINILNSQGQLIQKLKFENQTNISLDLQNLNSGYYQLMVNDGKNEIVQKKFIKID